MIDFIVYLAAVVVTLISLYSYTETHNMFTLMFVIFDASIILYFLVMLHAERSKQ